MPAPRDTILRNHFVLLAPVVLACTAPAAGAGGHGTEPSEAPAPHASPSKAAPPVAARPSASSALRPAPLPFVDGCPQEMVRIGKYCVDRYEAHLVRLEREGEVPHDHNVRPLEGVRYAARSAPSVYPQAYVSRVESEAACKEAGKRLCSFGEWRRACGGKRWQRYPYGHVEIGGACSSGKDQVLIQLHGSDSARWKYDEHFNDPFLDIVPGFLDRAGARPRCASDEGVFDMVGNLHEWVSGTVTEALMTRLENEDVERNEQPWQEGNGIFLGGFFSTTRELGPGCLYTTVAHEPGYHDYSTGFRCCMGATLDEAPKAKAR